MLGFAAISEVAISELPVVAGAQATFNFSGSGSFSAVGRLVSPAAFDFAGAGSFLAESVPPVPADRLVTVPFENRGIRIAARDRFPTVPGEDRYQTIERPGRFIKLPANWLFTT